MVSKAEILKHYSPEECLMVAVLQQSLEDLKHKHLRVDAWNFFVDNSMEHPYSFLNICQELNLNEDIIRTRVSNNYLYGKPLTRIIAFSKFRKSL